MRSTPAAAHTRTHVLCGARQYSNITSPAAGAHALSPAAALLRAIRPPFPPRPDTPWALQPPRGYFTRRRHGHRGEGSALRSSSDPAAGEGKAAGAPPTAAEEAPRAGELILEDGEFGSGAHGDGHGGEHGGGHGHGAHGGAAHQIQHRAVEKVSFKVLEKVRHGGEIMMY
jgi:hypothetical protein